MKQGVIFIVISALFLSLAAPSHATVVSTNSQDCSVIDTTDGHTEDWENITSLKEDQSSVEGTTYYYKDSAWVTEKPESPEASVNLDQWTDITLMKMCTTADDMFMMMETTWPMMTYKKDGKYVDWWYSVDGQGASLPLPADWPYNMVWKMQDVEGAGDIIYFVADIEMFEGVNDFDDGTDFPTLWLYEETNTELSFEDATWNPAEDTKLTRIALSDDEEANNDQPDCEDNDQDCQENNFEEISEELEEFQAFEVRQQISELFEYADFSYGDVINISVAMYNMTDLNIVSESHSVYVTEQTDTASYKMSKRGVRKLRALKNSKSEESIRLQWRPYKSNERYAKAYQIKVWEEGKVKPVQIVRNTQRSSYTIRNLEPGTTYRAIVRAVNHPDTYTKAKDKLSAWSSGYKWTTDPIQ